MPARRFLPNRRAFVRAVRATAVYRRAIYQEKVYTPVLRALGLPEEKLTFPQAGPTGRNLRDNPTRFW
jgi:hypothetical protein